MLELMARLLADAGGPPPDWRARWRSLTARRISMRRAR